MYSQVLMLPKQENAFIAIGYRKQGTKKEQEKYADAAKDTPAMQI